MPPTQLERRLTEGRQVPGMFWPRAADFATPGVLSWSATDGAELELVDLSHPWPTDFDTTLTVHGQPHDGEELTLFDARVRTVKMFDRTSRLTSPQIGLGAHVDSDTRWVHSHFRPSRLHEWLPETGLSISGPTENQRRLVVEWNAPDRLTVTVEGGEVSLAASADWTWSHAPGWSIETTMTFSVTPDAPLTIDEHRRLFGQPLLGFVIFAADKPDDVTRESYYNPEDKTGIVVLQRGRNPTASEWQPIPGRYLFLAEDVDDVATAIGHWLDVWRLTRPSLALFRQAIEEGNLYSAPRYLTLYTAAESYWKNTKTTKGAWSPRALAERAAVSSDVTGATDEAIAMIGAARDYHAHLKVDGPYSAEQIEDDTYASTRRLHALLQACLLRDIGIPTDSIERLLAQHYRDWPIP